MRDALNAEILLDGRLVAAEHSEPVDGTTDDDTPETVSYRRIRIHVKKFYSPGLHAVLPNERNPARPSQSITQDEEQRTDKNGGLERVGHDYGFHATLLRQREHTLHRVIKVSWRKRTP